MKSIKWFSFTVFLGTFLILALACTSREENPRALVEKMAAEVGGINKLYSLKDVEYTYTYHDLATDKKDISLERYVFDGELSWAKYEVREKNVVPQMEGEVIQAYNGTESWMTINGALVEEPQLMKLCDFLRKTNYYWFTMMFKLLDPGVQYEYNGTKTVDGIEYDLVKIAFGEGVGDVQDTYVLYINPKTNLVDRFLFTVMDFGMKEPFLMKVEYEEVAGLKLPAKRKAVQADWEGVPKNDNWVAEISTNIKFNNGFDRSMFDKPSNLSEK
ncbi:MAG: DUF6503 family protein [bacterium]